MRRRSLALCCLGCLVAGAPSAWASGGFEIDEQSAPQLGMAGAFTAVANDPSAIFANPAGLALQPGFGAQGGGYLIIARTHVAPDNITLWHPVAVPTLYVAQRLGHRFSLGIGSFANFGEHFNYPRQWRGRFTGYFIDITTYTINPTAAIRIFDWLAVGGGVDIVPGSFDLYRALNFGGGEGSLHVGMTDVGIGGNVGVLAEIVPRHLRIGVSYRTRVDMHYSGDGAITAPPELRALTGGLQHARLNLPLPHNFAIGLAGFVGQLIVSVDVKVSIWRDLDQLTLTLTDPAAPAGTPPTSESVPLHYKNTWAIRVGAQYGFLGDRLRVRAGGGYDQSPQPLSTLGPLAPDTNRALGSVGIGWHWRWLSVDLAYLATFLLKRTSSLPDLIATYDSVGQVVSLTGTLRFTELWDRPLPSERKR